VGKWNLQQKPDMKAADLIRDLSSLPPEAQREVIDFITVL
jgi:hypothetical protein